jgi:hypothetical protein
MTVSIFELDEAFLDDEPRPSPAIPPPPLSDVTELRLAKDKPPATVVGAVFVWAQGDAYAITHESDKARPPTSDVSALHPQLRDTVRPGRRCA